jgi:DNA-binding NarL/FixJ family response regulator
MDRILVIDDLPLIATAFQEVFRSINPSTSVAYCENIYSALSSKNYAGVAFDLVILGSAHERWSAGLDQGIRELKDRFGGPALLLYSEIYEPAIIAGMKAAGIDAYVHRHESIGEIREACHRLSAGTPYISGIFRTLYYDYGYK